jgi:hypothetical protein
VILCWILTGRLPFAGENLTEIISAVLVGALPKPSAVAPELPPALDVIILRCLERDLDRRYRTVAELAEDLAPFAPPRGRESVERIRRLVPHGSPRVDDSVAAGAVAGEPTEAQSTTWQRTTVGRLTIAVAPEATSLDSLEIRRDGVIIGKPLWGVPVPVDPGEHVVTASAPGKKGWESRVIAAESAALRVAISPLEEGPRTPPPVADAVAPRPRRPVPAIVLSGVAAVGVGVGAGLFAAHASQKSDAESLSAGVRSAQGTCVPPRFAAPCSAIADKAKSSDLLGNASTVAFAAGGAAAVAMVVYLVLPASPRATGGAVTVRPVFGVGHVGLAGSF